MTDTNQWLQQAACRGLDPELFYPERKQRTTNAKAVCADCPVRQECLDDAMANETQRWRHGIFGGLTAQERDLLVRGKKRTYPRPECGTEAGYNSHRRHGEHPDQAYIDAIRIRNTERREARRNAERSAA